MTIYSDELHVYLCFKFPLNFLSYDFRSLKSQETGFKAALLLPPLPIERQIYSLFFSLYCSYELLLINGVGIISLVNISNYLHCVFEDTNGPI